MTAPMPQILRGDARSLPLPDASVDLIVTSPPYFGLRSYQDGGEHYDGQVGAEATPVEFVEALIEVTRECMRVLKPTGSLFVNLGDGYASRSEGFQRGARDGVRQPWVRPVTGVTPKSLFGIPWRYAIRCVDELGLVLRQELIWSKPNGLPESVTDRCRRSHEQWFHFTTQRYYYAAVDEIREPHERAWTAGKNGGRTYQAMKPAGAKDSNLADSEPNPLGKLPGSVWEIATQPLKAPASLGVDHFAAFPMEWPRRLIHGWSPREVCTECGKGRRPVASVDRIPDRPGRVQGRAVDALVGGHGADGRAGSRFARTATVTGYACDCPDTSAPSAPGVVLDPFGGTGTTALVATMLGRRGISVDLSADYCRLAEWRASDPKERARAAGLDPDAVARVHHQIPGQFDLLDLFDNGEAS